MRVETLLPLGKLDPGLRAAETPIDLQRVGDDAALVESLGYDGLACEETKDDPYVVLALAAQSTTRLRLTTAIAMAFPRSPTITRCRRGRCRSSQAAASCSDSATS